MSRTVTTEGPDSEDLASAVAACRNLIESRFPGNSENGAAAVLLANGAILTGTSPEFLNPSTSVCHEIEPYCAAYRLGERITASVCLHRTPDRQFLVLSPCGVCRERLATYGPEVRVAVPGNDDATEVHWVTLRAALPHYWVTVFPEDVPEWVA